MFDALKRYADFQGRSRRKEYWLFYLLNMIVIIIGYIIVGAGMVGSATVVTDEYGISTVSQPQMGGLALLGSAILGIWFLLTLIPNIAVTIRRMHDQDRSGWWMFVPLANFIFLFIEGTRGPNRFGPDSKGY